MAKTKKNGPINKAGKAWLGAGIAVEAILVLIVIALFFEALPAWIVDTLFGHQLDQLPQGIGIALGAVIGFGGSTTIHIASGDRFRKMEEDAIGQLKILAP